MTTTRMKKKKRKRKRRKKGKWRLSKWSKKQIKMSSKPKKRK